MPDWCNMIYTQSHALGGEGITLLQYYVSKFDSSAAAIAVAITTHVRCMAMQH
jgi:hypothetical protein